MTDILLNKTLLYLYNIFYLSQNSISFDEVHQFLSTNFICY